MRKILIAILFLISANAYCQFDGIIPSTPITLSSLPAGIFTTSNLDTTKIFFNDQNNSVTGRNTFSDKQSFTDTLDVNKLIADSITVGFINGSAYNPFDSSQYVKRSAFSQSIEASGGSFTITSSNQNVLINTPNGSLFINGDQYAFIDPSNVVYRTTDQDIDGIKTFLAISNFNAGASFTGNITSQNITPTTDNLYSLGDNSHEWQKIFLDHDGSIMINGNSQYATSGFGSISAPEVTSATQSTVTLTINGITHTFYVVNE